MKRYKVFDVVKGPFGCAMGEFEANSPMDAIKQAGYNNIQRDYSNRGNIVIQYFNGKTYRSYVYYADERKN